MKSDRLSDRSTPSTLERRLSEQAMLIDPPHTIEGRTSPPGLIGEGISVQSAPHAYLSHPQPRPPFAHSLSYGSTSSPSLSGSYNQPYLPPASSISNYPKGYGAEPLHSQNEILDKSDSHSIHSGSQIAPDTQSSINDYNALNGHPASYGTSADPCTHLYNTPDR